MQYVNIKFPKNLEIFFTFFSFRKLPIPNIVQWVFKKFEINVLEPEAPFAFKEKNKSAFLLFNIGNTLIPLLIILFIAKQAKKQVTKKKKQVAYYERIVTYNEKRKA